MKTTTVNGLLALLFGFCLLFACKPEAPADSESADAENTEESTSEEESFRDILYVVHDVEDYDQWKPGFDDHESARLESGIHKIGVARNLDTPNKIHLSFFIDDLDKARAFTESDELKTIMEEVGVVGPPTIQFLKVLNLVSEPTDITQRVMVAHEVADYDSWKKVYDEHKPARDKAGREERALLHEIGNPNNVFMVFSYGDRAKVEEFMGSEDLSVKMEEAGVTGEVSADFINWEELSVE